jgi:hypothetical protein
MPAARQGLTGTLREQKKKKDGEQVNLFMENVKTFFPSGECRKEKGVLILSHLNISGL